MDRYVARDGGPLEPDVLRFARLRFARRRFARLRFDTLSALVYEPFIDGSGAEWVFEGAPCPFDADFGATVEGPGSTRDFEVTGGYDGLLVFGGSVPGTGEDSLYTPYKEYTFDAEVFTFVADFGEVFRASEVGAAYGLYFARIDGVEHGPGRYPVRAEPPPEQAGSLTLRMWPNPSRGRATAAFSMDQPAPVRLSVLDAMGWAVWEGGLGVLGAGRHEVALDLSGLAAGTYFLRLSAGPTSATRAVARIERRG